MKRTKQVFVVLFLIGLLLNLLGCASGVKYSDYVKDMPEVNEQQSRLFVYRVSSLGAAVQPKVKVDDVTVCKAVPKGFAFSDVKPGDHKVQCSTEVNRSLSLTTNPGQTKYVRLDVSWGFFVGHISPKLVDEDVALKDLQKCKYVGN